MRLSLREFQTQAVEELALLLDSARYGYRLSGKGQAVGLTACTGAGKTIIATALIERVIFGTDDGSTAPDPGAVFLWMTDLPQLNIQTRTKMLTASSLLGPDRLVIVENTFDEATLAPGRVYFLNTQKLGINAALAQGPSPKRNNPFWAIVRNTIETPGRMLYLVVDEAHRGMTEGKDREEANSIIQRFIKGITDVMPPVPIVLGISATPDRYANVVENSGRTISQHSVPPEEVRASGLIKELISATVAGEKQTDALALLPRAVDAWKDSTERWATYCAAANEETVVVPALIVQVENEAGGKVTQTDLASVIRVIIDVAGPLPPAAFVQCFGEATDVMIDSRKIRYLEPSRVTEDQDARVVFFKTSLGTGWDCPRAEVMFSFRRAVDATSIAQTIGRMVRTPLARRIEEDERLNSVDVFLPHYNRKAVEKIVAYLRDSGDSSIGDSIRDSESLVSLPRRPDSDRVVAAIEAVPSYLVPIARQRQEVRRLADLARSLSKHGIDPDAFSGEMSALANSLLVKRNHLVSDASFQKAVNDQGEIVIDRVEWAVGEASIITDKTLVIPASDESVSLLFAGAKRTLGGDAVAAYWKARVAADPTTTSTARLEAYALSQRYEVMRELNDEASSRIDALFKAHGPTIEELPPAKRSTYERIRGQAPDPSQVVIHLPQFVEFTRGKDRWPRHLYAAPTGEVSLTFNTWETEALRADLDNTKVVAWLRNVPNKDWALCVRWRDKNAWHPLYPDFLIVREEGGRLVVDIIDPHDHTRPDAPKKAQGLAEYAQAHSHLLGGHIDLIAKVGGRLRRLHLEDDKTRKEIAAADSPDALLALYTRA